jgi:ABC-type uncharacterized transport system auxiliary subunit
MRHVAIVAIVSACALTAKSPPRELRYFSLDVATSPPASSTPCARVRLGRVSASSHLRLAIEHRLSAVEIQPYETLRWTESPETYARRALEGALFSARPLEQAVSGPVAVLDVDVVAFEEAHGAGLVELRFELRDDHRVIARGSSRLERRASSPSIEGTVIAIGAALAAASAEIADRVVASTCSR